MTIEDKRKLVGSACALVFLFGGIYFAAKLYLALVPFVGEVVGGVFILASTFAIFAGAVWLLNFIRRA